MSLFEDLEAQAYFLDAAAFARRNPGLFLLGESPAESEDDGDWSFETRVTGNLRDLFNASGGDGGSGTVQKFLHRIEKSERNPWKRRISVGRATTNDIVLRHPSVSKLHAHFLRVPKGEGEEAGWALVDGGSSNGTEVNEDSATTGSEVPIAAGDRVLFGAVRCEVLDGRRLHEVLRARRGRKGTKR